MLDKSICFMLLTVYTVERLFFQQPYPISHLALCTLRTGKYFFGLSADFTVLRFWEIGLVREIYRFPVG